MTAQPVALSLGTARRLLDFRGASRALSEAAAEEQLQGAVALHNILVSRDVAYLADEVGKGKTYVALGALALFRHFNPSFRLIVVAPRANIQRKWVKELRNFVRNNFRVTDLRVKAVHGAPARPIVSCGNLAELVREATVNPDRDFFTRLSSFSLPLGQQKEQWRERRDELLRHLPWANADEFPLAKARRAEFKAAYGRTLCKALPHFDLVIVDEGHNLKHGLSGAASDRNGVLARAFGHASEAKAGGKGYGPRAGRVLFLSATPVENDYEQLWNQLDVFGMGDRAPALDPKRAEDFTDDQRRACAQEFLIRRLTTIPTARRRLTKNQYRREWQAGGVTRHDEPLEISGPDRERQRLVVALVQKKVSEVLRDPKFSSAFQIGMLASFESFLQTAGVKTNRGNEEEACNFDGDQTDEPDERLGVDVGEVNRLAADYRSKFGGAELPHPKMDALVEHLAEGLPQGRKSLVFVRRVASVKELQSKLEDCYDRWLFERLRRELPKAGPELESAIRAYTAKRSRRSSLTPSVTLATSVAAEAEDGAPASVRARETGSLASFFAYFFRGRGPKGMLSGAALKQRFDRDGSYATFFEDNYVAWLLNVPPRGDKAVLAALVQHLGRPMEQVIETLRRRAAAFVGRRRQPQLDSRWHLFMAAQSAGLGLLAASKGPLAEKAELLRRELNLLPALQGSAPAAPAGIEGRLETPTFFSSLRDRPALRRVLWPEPSRALTPMQSLREQELRRLLLGAQARLGHAFIDLYVLAVKQLGTLKARAREKDAGSHKLIEAYLALLEEQRAAPDPQFRAFQELSLTAEAFDLIIDVNRPELRKETLGEAAGMIGQLLGSQQPVGGMFGAINETLVRQFRCPGYPIVLLTTDLLQEGEDLHTFCSEVYHYGISWMPSAMEQRVGRVDRVNSHTERRLKDRPDLPPGHDLLQVYYPHLRETVEVIQVERVLERMRRFMQLMHRDLRQPEAGAKRIDLARAVFQRLTDIAPVSEELKSAFPVQPKMLIGQRRVPVVDAKTAAGWSKRFGALRAVTRVAGLRLTWERHSPDDMLLGTAYLPGGRQQPFSLVLRSLEGRLMVRCLSPVGRLNGYRASEIKERTEDRQVQVGAFWDEGFESYDLNVEAEALLGPPTADLSRVQGLVKRVVTVADELERTLLERDEWLKTFRRDLGQETPDAQP